MILFEGAVIALAGVVLGRFLPARRRTPKLAPSKPLRCDGCGHHRSLHKNGTGGCAWKDAPRHISFVGMHTPTCACQQYHGPEPLPEYVATEIGA